MGELAHLPRSNNGPTPEIQDTWTKVAVAIGVGLPAVGAAIIGSMAPTPVAASGVATSDLAELTLFSPVEAPETDAPKRELDKNEKEMKEKLTRYVDEEFAGDYEAAFASFDSTGDGQLGSRELRRALEKIGVGNFFTRGTWVDGIMERMDTSGNGQLTFPELWSSLS